MTLGRHNSARRRLTPDARIALVRALDRRNREMVRRLCADEYLPADHVRQQTLNTEGENDDQTSEDSRVRLGSPAHTDERS